MNNKVFVTVLVIGFVSFILTNLLWEWAGGKVTKSMIFIGAIVVVLIAWMMGVITR